MSHIDHTYFFAKLNLPQVGNTEGRTEVQQFIDRYEPEFLQKVLGRQLWEAFDEGTDGSGEPTEQRWIDLLEGAEWSFNGVPYKWRGFVSDQKVSPIANYVYWHYVKNLSNPMTLVGPVVPATSNADRIAPLSRMVETWNEMVDMLKPLQGFLYVNRDVYPEWGADGNLQHVIGWVSPWAWVPKADVFHKQNEFNI